MSQMSAVSYGPTWHVGHWVFLILAFLKIKNGKRTENIISYFNLLKFSVHVCVYLFIYIYIYIYLVITKAT